MLLGIIVCLAIVIALLVYEVIRREITKHATLIVRKEAQSVTDEAMKSVVDTLVDEGIFRIADAHLSESRLVADVWGKGVMAFEYVLVSERFTQVNLVQLRQVLDQSLREYSLQHSVSHVEQAKDAFRVTDIWVYEQHLHVDVAYLINEATYQYIYDLKKLT